jgi:hypothetical protein
VRREEVARIERLVEQDPKIVDERPAVVVAQQQ